ncbi:MAG: uroporphyrinogen decarboxylase [bacterium]|nr:uroporphyrinogen decarboxylase [bacterium]
MSAREPLFLAACRGKTTVRRPVWLMRQAGRILAPYRDLKEQVGSIELMFRDPAIATEVTLMPVELLGVDAAILFADIFTPVDPMGCSVTFDPGPVLEFYVSTPEDVARLHTFDAESELSYVADIIGRIRGQLPESVPLIGFAGSPFTLATYMAETGGRGREFTGLRRLLHTNPATALALIDKLTDVAIDYLSMQVRAGAQALQLFDTWIGALSLADFEAIALPRLQRIFQHLSSLGVPTIYYANDAAHLVSALDRVGADVLSVDWRTDIVDLFARKPGRPVQGNFDPLALFAAPDVVEAGVRELLQRTDGQPHIFNLGHGVHPETPYDSVVRLVETVKNHHPGT